MLTQNPFSSITHNYSSDSKKFTENFISIWANFVKHDNPNYGKNKSERDYWKSFLDEPADLKSSSKLTNGNYISFNNREISMKSDFSMHMCNFWDGNSRKNDNKKDDL